MKSKIMTGLSLIPVFLAIFVYFNMSTLKLILFSVTDAMHGSWPEINLTCPKDNTEAFNGFFNRLIPTPTIQVKSFDECFEIGEKTKNPLICRLSAEISKPDRVIEAIKGDNTTYDLLCREGGDFHWVRPADGKQQGTLLSMLEKPSWCGAGFIYGDKHEEILAEVIHGLNKTFDPALMVKQLKGGHGSGEGIKFATSFISNLPEPAITTGTHAAMIISLVFQLTGQKIWILHNREESSAEYYFDVSWRTYPLCLGDWLKALRRPWVAVTNPGDLLYFPLAYEHLVFTDQGVNLMTNIRKIFKPSREYARERFSFKNLMKIAAHSTLKSGASRGNPRDGVDLESGIQKILKKVVQSTSDNERQEIKKLGNMLYQKYH
jgi:hypothetical protein